MARPEKYDVLFEPVSIGPKTLRNRFYQTAHCTGAGSDRPEFQASFRAMKAEGGWAAVSTEYCSIAPESDDTNRVSARLWDEGDVRNLSVMCERVHDHDALAAVELWHGGSLALGLEAREVARGVTAGPGYPQYGRGGVGVDKSEIRDIQELYVAAADRARRAGFDILTVYAAHAFALPHLFLLPQFNTRTDEYGGSFENRCRFARELLEILQERLDGSCAISVRFGIDTLDDHPGGIRAHEEGLAFVEHLDHLVDLWDITVGAAEPADAPPSRTHGQNEFKEYVSGVKGVTQKPVMTVGRFTDPDIMAQAISSGQIDIIGAARPSIADPFLPKKIEEGRLDEIRECIGCNVCLSRWEIGGPPIICTQNATAGEEYRRGWHPERFTPVSDPEQDVLIVGAGPAGLECATVLAKRGLRRVHLVDAAPEIGGLLRWVSRLPGLGEWARVVNYRAIQLAKARNVELILKTELDRDSTLEYGADIVITATGSEWMGNGMNSFTRTAVPGADSALAHVFTPEQLMLEGKAMSAEHVTVYDCDGYYMGVGMAELLASQGHVVTLLTPFEAVAPYTRFTLEAPALRAQLRSLGVRVVRETLLAAISPGQVSTTSLDGADNGEHVADAVVLVTQREPNDGLFRALREQMEAATAAGIRGVYRIGDCVAPQLIADAVFSGHRLAREIDSGEPARALPFLRERPEGRPKRRRDSAVGASASSEAPAR